MSVRSTPTPRNFAVIFAVSFHFLAVNFTGAEEVLELAAPKNNLDSVTSVAFSQDGRYVLSGYANGTARIWDLVAGKMVRQIRGGHTKAISSVAFSPSGRLFLTGGKDGEVWLWKAETGEQLFGMGNPSAKVTAIAFGKSEFELVVGLDDKSIRVFDAADAKETRRIKGHRAGVNDLAVSDDATRILSGSSDGTARYWDAADGEELDRLEGHDGPVVAVAMDRTGRHFLTAGADKTVRTWDMDSGQQVGRLQITAPGTLACAAFSPDRRLVVTSTAGGPAELWDLKDSRVLRSLQGNSRNLLQVSFAPDGLSVFGCVEDGVARFWDVKEGRELCSLIGLLDQTWVVTNPEGRFFTDDPDRPHGLGWVVPDDPAMRLPVELLIHDYFQPRLLPMALNGEPFGPIQPLGRLNRALPVVEISGVKRVGTGDQLEVTVEVSPGVATARRDGKDVTLKTAPYDLRLFREGQLVGQWPTSNERDEDDFRPAIDEDRAWRGSHLIEGGPAGGKVSRTFIVRLPHRKEPKALEISAYAFNEDRVKSVTARHVYQLPEDIVDPKRRAYLIAMGVNVFEDPSWNLNFAASDARRVQEALGSVLRGPRKFEVVPIRLISDRGAPRPGEAPATRDNLRAILATLSRTGKPDDGLERRIPGADRLRPATPDDLVFVFTSTHGYTKPGSGVYYLFPQDIGPPPQGGARQDVSDRLLAHCVSSGELSAWLRAVDAGHLALVVDACHAAATIDQPGFKPGPMGSRGLGQLAYDKGMRVLAASAADDVALEIDAVRHGLLTYALVREGLEQEKGLRGRIALEGTKLTLGGWFSYAEQRVPGLYQEIRKGKVRDLDDAPVPGVTVVVGSKGIPVPLTGDGDLPPGNTLRKPKAFQHPVHFDFSKGPDDVILKQTEVAEGGRPSRCRPSPVGRCAGIPAPVPPRNSERDRTPFLLSELPYRNLQGWPP